MSTVLPLLFVNLTLNVDPAPATADTSMPAAVNSVWSVAPMVAEPKNCRFALAKASLPMPLRAPAFDAVAAESARVAVSARPDADLGAGDGSVLDLGATESDEEGETGHDIGKRQVMDRTRPTDPRRLRHQGKPGCS
jgi:hypothetical protein